MDDNANRSTINEPRPVPPPGDTTAPPPSVGASLKSTLKIVIPLAVFAAVVFGVTILYLNVPTGDPTKTDEKNVEPPLRFARTNAYWDPPNLSPEYRGQVLTAPSRHPLRADDPTAFNLQDRAFQGLYESGKTPRYAVFWFETRHPGSISLQLKYASCSACSGGRIAMVSPEALRDLRDDAARLAVFQRIPLAVPLAVPAVQFFNRLEWQEQSFLNNPDATFRIPSAPPGADPNTPRLGILVFTFEVGDASKVLEMRFASHVDGTEIVGTHEFRLVYESVKPLELTRPVVDAGELSESSGERTYYLYAYSATRGPGSEFGDLAPLVPTNQIGDFVQVTAAERVPEGDLLEATRDIEKALGRPMRVRSAYRLTVVVRPKVGDARLDIGFLDRTIPLTAGDATQTLRVTARMKGIVWLNDSDGKGSNTIDLKTYSGREKQEFTRLLVTQTNTIQLEVNDDECRPRGVYKLEKQPDQGGQGYYKLKITVPAGKFGNYEDGKGMVVLDVKGDRPQKVKIPVTGFAEYK